MLQSPSQIVAFPDHFHGASLQPHLHIIYILALYL